MRPSTERRSYYRINDLIGLRYRVVDTDDTGLSAGTSSLDMPVTSLLAEIDREFNQASNILWQEDPTVAQALGLLNRKLSIIAAHSLREDGEDSESYEEMMVSLSGSGISFNTPDAYSPGTRLLISLTLQPSNISLDLTGTVNACEPGKTEDHPEFRLRISFDPENETALEQLIQHVVQRQCAQIQQKA